MSVIFKLIYVSNWEGELARLNTTRQNLYRLLDDTELTEDLRIEFVGKLNTNQGQMAQAQASLEEAQAALSAIVAAQDNDEQLQAWLTDNQAALSGLVQRVAGSNSAQRHQLVMAMLPGKIVIEDDGAVVLSTLRLEVDTHVLGHLLNMPDM